MRNLSFINGANSGIVPKSGRRHRANMTAQRLASTTAGATVRSPPRPVGVARTYAEDVPMLVVSLALRACGIMLAT
jgi:hypothetical protein